MTHTQTTHSGPLSTSYRPDIDGLRGIAVSAVLLNHLRLGPFEGGFVGVDIFFVISGFLISGIVQREVLQGKFTFADFYHRRVRRLLPALFAVLIATFLFGIAVLLPSDLVLVAKGMAATLLFGSNVFFWRTSGYFDSSSEFNPLLHTWSLSVEEQFYIIFPCLLLLTHRLSRRRVVGLLALAAVCSFGACVFIQSLRPTATFYLAPFRAWEMLVGSLIALAPIPPLTRRLGREVLSLIGLALIGGALLATEPGLRFPGWQAAVPVLGTAMLISSGSSGDSFVRRALSSRGLVFVGLISYSLYLWHWPVLVFARHLNGLQPLEWRLWVVLLVSIALAILSHRFVETPFRRPSERNSTTRVLVFAFAASAALVITVLAVVKAGGFPNRFAPSIVALDNERSPEIPLLECSDRRFESMRSADLCRIGDKKATTPSVLLWGDSHALAWAPALDATLRDKGVAAFFISRSACAPILDVINPANPDCLSHNRQVWRFLQENPQVKDVVLMASWVSYSSDSEIYELVGMDGAVGNSKVFPPSFTRSVSTLLRDSRRVWLVGPTPGAPADAPLRLAMAATGRAPLPPGKRRDEFLRSAANFYSAAHGLPPHPGLTVIDPAPWLCNADRCKYLVDGLPLYRDGGHLNTRGASYLQPQLASAFERLESPIRPGSDSDDAPQSVFGLP